MTKTFKVLMYAQTIVDYGLLVKGIYGTEFPKLYAEETTMETLIKELKWKHDNMPHSPFLDDVDEYYKIRLENLLQCQLKEVLLTIK